MIERVWERVRQATSISAVLVATDDERIRSAVEAFGGEAVMTRADHRSGTERVAEVAAARKDADILVNVQGDEPLIEPAAIDQAVEAIGSDAEVDVATLAVPIGHPPDIMDPNVVKAVLDFDGNALYFSRAPIPWVRDRGGPVTRSTSSIWALCLPPEGLAGISDLPAGRPGAHRAARTASLAGERLSHPRGGDRVRFDRRRHAGSVAPSSSCSATTERIARTYPNSEKADAYAAVRATCSGRSLSANAQTGLG